MRFREQWVYCVTTDALRGKSSLRGIGGLSLLLGPQCNYQRLQAALLPGMEWLSQGYYFPAELSGSQTQHLNNLVFEGKKKTQLKKLNGTVDSHAAPY